MNEYNFNLDLQNKGCCCVLKLKYKLHNFDSKKQNEDLATELLSFTRTKDIICCLFLECRGEWITQGAVVYGHVLSNCVVATCA